MIFAFSSIRVLTTHFRTNIHLGVVLALRRIRNVADIILVPASSVMASNEAFTYRFGKPEPFEVQGEGEKRNKPPKSRLKSSKIAAK